MKALVVGYGSIGSRHARLLKELGCQVAVVSRRSIEFSPHYFELDQALKDWQPEYIVIAGRTSEHREKIKRLVDHGFKGSVLVEKPLFERTLQFPPHQFSRLAIAYNLRFHPLLLKLKSLLDNAEQVVTAHIYAGSFLPDWRPNTDYRQSYSAIKNKGGGVLRDLSHELDYTLWLFGSWRQLTASGGHFSRLEIDSDDAYTLIMETQFCPLVTIHINYLDRIPRREILVNTDNHTIQVDLINNTIAIDGRQDSVTIERDDTYRAEHQAMLAGNIEGLCTLDHGIEVLRTIEAAEQATLQTKIVPPCLRP